MNIPLLYKLRRVEKEHYVYITIFLILIILNIVFFLLLEEKSYWTDEAWYIKSGKDIISGYGFEYAPLKVIGYPFFLAIVYFFGDSFLLLRLANLFCGLLSALLSYKITYELYENKRIARIAACFIIIYPFFIYIRGFALSENLIIPFILLISWLLILCSKKQSIFLWFITGLVTGISILVRPVFLFIPLIIPLIVIINDKYNYKKIIIYTITFIIPFVIIIFLWMYRNYTYNNEFYITRFGYCEIYKGMATPPGEPVQNYPTPGNSQDCKEAAISYIKEEFPSFLYHKIYYTLKFWSPQFDHLQSQKEDSPFQVISYLILIPLYLLSIISFIKSKNKYKFVVLLIVIIYWFFYIITIVCFRFRIPIESLFLIFVAGISEKQLYKIFNFISSKK